MPKIQKKPKSRNVLKFSFTETLNSPLRYEISLVNLWNLAELISSFFLDRYGIDPEVRGSRYTELRDEDVPFRKKS